MYATDALQDAIQLALQRAHGDVQLRSDLPVATALADRIHYLALTLRRPNGFEDRALASDNGPLRDRSQQRGAELRGQHIDRRPSATARMVLMHVAAAAP